MKDTITDPWLNTQSENKSQEGDNNFEDSFVSNSSNSSRLPDSDEYLARLCK